MAKHDKHNSGWPIWKLIVAQILLTGLVLCIFATFHHVIPDIRLRLNGMPQPIGTVERKEEAPISPVPTESPELATPTEAPEVTTPVESPEQPEATPELPAETAEPTPTPIPTPQPWSVRFAEQFTSDVERSETHYSSPNVAITVTQYDHPEDFPDLTCFVADIYLTDIAQFATGFPQEGTFDSGTGIAKSNDAILAINGDSMLTQQDGFLVRNGQIFREQENTGDLCVLYYDGSMEIYSPGTYTRQEILDREPYQIWQFGPSLLDEEGQPLASFNISSDLQKLHPRTAIGYYEPGHYCFVVVDGRQGEYSVGATMTTLAELMSSLGCRSAYNLDGGASSMMVFDGKLTNRQSGERYINDMLIIRDPVGSKEGIN